jgi:hypothetical protein
MDLSSGGISGMVFKVAVRGDLSNFSLDSHMLSVVMELDGKKSLGDIAEKLGLNINSLREVVPKLLQLKLIEAVEKEVPVLDADFMNHLRAQYSLAIGPIAGVIIEDEIKDMGYSMAGFPSNRAAELIDVLARDIQRDQKRSEFKQSMVQKIMEKGY